MASPGHLSQGVSSPPAILCNCCRREFAIEDRFFSCFRCSEEKAFNVCQACLLSETISIDPEHVLGPCFIDSRDARPTCVPHPTAEEFKNLIEAAQADPSFKLPLRAQRFFSAGSIHGLSNERVKVTENYEVLDDEEESARTKKVSNDYSL